MKKLVERVGGGDAVTKEVFTVDSTTYITAETVEVFLQRLRDMTPDIPIAVAMGNARYQHCKAAMGKANNLGIKLPFLPPYSPNLNITERLWSSSRNPSFTGDTMTSRRSSTEPSTIS